MKLGYLMAAGASASFIETFELIPDGYHGTYQNWNVTQLLVENEDDELFQAFEEEVSLKKLNSFFPEYLQIISKESAS